jgi:hypothetical protein
LDERASIPLVGPEVAERGIALGDGVEDHPTSDTVIDRGRMDRNAKHQP